MIEGVRGKGRIEERRRMNQINHQSIINHFFSSVRPSDQNRRLLKPSFEMSDLFTATTAAQVEEALARGEDIEQTAFMEFDVDGKMTSFRLNERAYAATGAEDEDEEEQELTPLTSACRRGELEVVDCLLKHGTDPKHCPSKYDSKGPIQWAAKEGHAAVLERLVRSGVSVNDNQGREGETALMIASEEGHVDVVDCLLSLGADVNTVNWMGETALMWASSGERVDVVDRLLAAGADANAVDMVGSSALIAAALKGNVPIIDRLVVHGADFNHRNEMGWSALMWASKNGHIEVVDRLLSLGCDVNGQNARGMTALMFACASEEIEIVRLLLDHGADPLLCNKDGKRAIDLARSPEIQTLLNGLILLSFHHHHHHHVP